jgi:hypothetical protein
MLNKLTPDEIGKIALAAMGATLSLVVFVAISMMGSVEAASIIFLMGLLIAFVGRLAWEFVRLAFAHWPVTLLALVLVVLIK